MDSHPLADETLGTLTFGVSSGNSVQVTPMMRRRPDGLCNIAFKQKWVTTPSEADLEELKSLLAPGIKGMTRMDLSGTDTPLTGSEADKVTAQVLMKDDHLH